MTVADKEQMAVSQGASATINCPSVLVNASCVTVSKSRQRTTSQHHDASGSRKDSESDVYDEDYAGISLGSALKAKQS
jgi:hypothetical protein